MTETVLKLASPAADLGVEHENKSENRRELILRTTLRVSVDDGVSAVTQMAKHLEMLNVIDPQSAARTVVHLIRGYELERQSYHKPYTENLSKRLSGVLATQTQTDNPHGSLK